MDIEKLIERLRTDSLYADKASLEIMDLCMDAATALQYLREGAEEVNAALQEKIKENAALHAENEKLRAELRRQNADHHEG